MKKLFTFMVAVFLTATLWAQSPEKMSYQAVIRNSSEALVTNTTVGMQISILQGSASGTAVYVETQSPTTNANGLISIKIGDGTVQSGDFTNIEWANGPYFIKTETDPAGGTDYTITGTSQLLSVPYALHAKTAESVSGTITETDPVFTAWDKSTGISITESQISDLDHFTTANETDPVYGASVASGITATDTTSWNNKLDSETDPEFNAWDKTTGISITESQISDLDHFTTADETDPVFGASVASDITATDTTSWNNKLDSETDPVFTAWDKDYADLINTPAAADGSETKVTAGTNVTVIGSGTTASPYVISATAGSDSTTYSVGDFAQGGIVFWVDETGQHGLVAAKEDQSTGIQWYNGTYTVTNAVRNGIGAGMYNTERIIANQRTGSYAGQLCANYQGGGYGDWYLPSKYELNLMYQNKATIDATAGVNGGSGFASAYYWSSTESSNSSAWEQYFVDGNQYGNRKATTDRVRAVRAF